MSAALGAAAPPALSQRTRALLQAPILSTLLRMAWPNILVMLAQASTGLIETWWVSRLGTDALAGMALVFPGVMLMQMISGGAMGGGISSAIAPRARGPAPGRCGRAGAACAGDQRGFGGSVLGHRAGRRALALPRLGRLRRVVVGGIGLFQRGVRRHRAAVADECAVQRDPRHRQHAVPGAGHLRRSGRADPALAVPDLRLGAVSGAGRGRRRLGADAVLSGRHRHHGLVSAGWPRLGAAACGPAALGPCSAKSSPWGRSRPSVRCRPTWWWR